jgi:paraquat-inducible protein B
MAEPEPTPQLDVPQATPASPRHRYLSLVWIVPMVAAAVAGWLAVQAMLRHGPTITISFVTAEGLEPGITRLRYKDVEIGTVSAVTLSEDSSRVLVTARMQKQAERLLREDTRFWVVKPRISASSVSGLGTLFSGAYIGVDAGSSAESRREFVGLEAPPVVIGGRPGKQFVLKSETLGSLDIGSPVYFRQVQVGQVVGFEIDPDGRGTSVQIFVNAPYDRFVKARSRFWLASGIDARFDAAGFQLNTESLVSILVGGIAFRTPPDAFDQPAAAASAAFDLFRDEASALRQPDTVVQPVRMVFHESVRGLAAGAPIDFRGITIGEVRSIELVFDKQRRRSSIEVRAELYPERLRSRTAAGKGADERLAGAAVLERLMQRGLAAQLRQGNLLTGQLYVALDLTPNRAAPQSPAEPGALTIPTMPSSFTELQTTVARIARKLEQLPLEELAADARRSLRSLDQTMAAVEKLTRSTEQTLVPEAGAALASLRETLAHAHSVLDADAPTQSELRATLREVAQAADAIRLLAEMLERQPEALLRGKGEKGESR